MGDQQTARIGEKNRLDLKMKVDTQSEMLSNSSNYVFHNLGGIDRSVSVLRCLQFISAAYTWQPISTNYQDAELKLDVTVDNPEKSKAAGLR